MPESKPKSRRGAMKTETPVPTRSVSDLAFASIPTQIELLKQGDLSARELTQLYLDRIERFDRDLNAFRVTFPERALAEADQADARRKGGDERALLGIPIAIKDDIDVAGETTQCGTNAVLEPAREDASVVGKLRAAGAIIIGKTNVPELMLNPFTETITYGATRNPWNRDFSPGGSSGGSAAAVAAGLVSAALGSDGLGSIRIPASCCGLVGIKPENSTIEMAARNVWEGLGVLGPLTRDVGSAALLLTVISKSLESLAAGMSKPLSGSGPLVDASGPLGGSESLAAAASIPPTTKLTVALSTKLPPGMIAALDPAVRNGVERVAEIIRNLGHKLVRQDPEYPAVMVPEAIARFLHGTHMSANMLGHNKHLSARTQRLANFGGLCVPKLTEWLTKQRAASSFSGLWNECDVLLTPVLTRPAMRIGELEGRGATWTLLANGRFAPYPGAFNVTGQPAIAIPSGAYANDVPIGVQLVGRRGETNTLVSLAAQIEAELNWADRRPANFG